MVATTTYQRLVRNAAEQRQELADEPGEAGQADRRERRGDEQAAEDRDAPSRALEVGDLAGVAALVEHADEEEQRAGGEAVRQHREHAAADARLVSAKMPSTTKPRCATDE